MIFNPMILVLLDLYVKDAPIGSNELENKIPLLVVLGVSSQRVVNSKCLRFEGTSVVRLEKMLFRTNNHSSRAMKTWEYFGAKRYISQIFFKLFILLSSRVYHVLSLIFGCPDIR